MFIRKAAGPHAVTLPSGRVMTRAELPPVDTRRWVASRKVALVKGVLSGLISPEEVMKLYDISHEELSAWQAAHLCHGPKALRTTRLQSYRQPKVDF